MSNAGWWQASDGNWYPPEAQPVASPPGPGWWQASDGQWYPPQSATPTPPTRVAPTPPPRPTPSRGNERDGIVPHGDAPAPDDVAPAGSPVGVLLTERATALARRDWVTQARSRLDDHERSLGRDDAAVDTVRVPGNDPSDELHRVVAELESGEANLVDLQRRREAAARAVGLAESAAKSARTKLIVAGVVAVLILLLILFFVI